MKHACFNYIKFENGYADEILRTHFNLPENLMKFKAGEQGYIGSHQYNSETKELTFISSWIPPIVLYHEWMKANPHLAIYYEYHEPMARICGAGHIAGKMHALTAAGYSNREEYEDVKNGRDWVHVPWNPLYEIKEKKLKKFRSFGVLVSSPNESNFVEC
jgi:hypothetical protein